MRSDWLECLSKYFASIHSKSKQCAHAQVKLFTVNLQPFCLVGIRIYIGQINNTKKSVLA